MVIQKHKLSTNKALQEAKTRYNASKVGVKVLLADYSKGRLKQLSSGKAIHSYGHLASLTGEPFEQGVTVEENLFNTAAIKILRYPPADVIEALFYSRVNDSAFESTFVRDVFDNAPIGMGGRLIAFPCPQFLRVYSEQHPEDGAVFLVPDRTVSELYASQFRGFTFLAMDQLPEIGPIDALLVFLRDADRLAPVYNLLQKLSPGAQALFLLPNRELDDRGSLFWENMSSAGCTLSKVLSLPTELINTSPRKKSLVYLEKRAGEETNSRLCFEDSSFDKSTREFSVTPILRSTTWVQFRDAGRSVIKEIRYLQSGEKPAAPKQRNRSLVYQFSKEIRLHYSRKGSDTGSDILRCHYYSCQASKKGGRGRCLASAEVRVGGRTLTEALSSFLLNGTPTRPTVPEAVCGDILAHCRSEALTMKTLWYLCRTQLKENRDYREQVAEKLFAGPDEGISGLVPATGTERDYINAVELSAGSEGKDDYRYWELLEMILKAAQRKEYIPAGNPIASIIASYRTSAELQEVRQSLLKRFLEPPYEHRLVERLAALDGERGLPLYMTDAFCFCLALKLFLGLSTPELCALTWADIVRLEYGDGFQMIVDKSIVDGKPKSYYSSNNPVKPRRIPLPDEVFRICALRKAFLVFSARLPKDALEKHPLMAPGKAYSKEGQNEIPLPASPRAFSAFVRRELDALEIPELSLILHDERDAQTLDLNNDYRGDFLRENARHRLCFTAEMKAGELAYLFGVQRPTTFDRNYLDYLYDLMQWKMACKIRRWTSRYAGVLFGGGSPAGGREIVSEGSLHISAGDGVKEVQVIISKNDCDVDSSRVSIAAAARHGTEWTFTGGRKQYE